MDLLRARDRKTSAWKNGGGTTTEIAVAPPGAGLGDFAWRISTAKVLKPGPFSTFEGIDRTLIVVQGPALGLQVAGQAPAVLTPDSPPFEFPGDAAARGEPIGGPITDLNVMTRRGEWRSRVRRRGAADLPMRLAAADTTLVLALEGQHSVTGPLGPMALGPADAVLLRAGETLALAATRPEDRMAIVDLWRVAPPTNA